MGVAEVTSDILFRIRSVASCLNETLRFNKSSRFHQYECFDVLLQGMLLQEEQLTVPEIVLPPTLSNRIRAQDLEISYDNGNEDRSRSRQEWRLWRQSSMGLCQYNGPRRNCQCYRVVFASDSQGR